MKKLLSLLLAAAMALTLASCSDQSAGNQSSGGSQAGSGSTAGAEVNWPTESITLNAGGPAGGSTDLVARVFAEYLSKEVGVPVVVSNGDSIVQYQNTHDAEPDGYTLGMGAMGFMIYGHVGTLDYGLDGFDAVGIASEDDTFGLWVTKDAPYQTLDELVEYMKANPGKVNIGMKTATSVHLEVVGFLSAVGCEANVVDAGGDAARVTALLGNQIDVTVEPIATMEGYMDEGDVVCLGTFQEESSALYPDIPTVYGQGYDFTFPTNFQAVFMPKGGDPALLDAIGTAVENVLNNEEYVAAINALGAKVESRSYEDTLTYLQDVDEQLGSLAAQIL